MNLHNVEWAEECATLLIRLKEKLSVNGARPTENCDNQKLWDEASNMYIRMAEWANEDDEPSLFIDPEDDDSPAFVTHDEFKLMKFKFKQDKTRMDWLETKCVEVRKPLFHGSLAMFYAQQISDDCDQYKTDLRDQIDAAMKAKL